MNKRIDQIFLLCTITVVGFQLSLPYFLGKSEKALYHTMKDADEAAITSKATLSRRSSVTSNTLGYTKVEMGNGVYARPFESWPVDKALPCLKPTKEKARRRPVTPADAHNGFLFMKLMKTGGSTAAGINVRVMREAAKASPVGKTHTFCQGRFEHCWGHEMLDGRGSDTSFAWTVVREPTERAVSQFYHFQVSRENIGELRTLASSAVHCFRFHSNIPKEPSDFYFQRYLASERKIFNHYYLQVLSTTEITPPQVNQATAPRLINQILEDYNFIGITERMEESAVCLMMLLNLKMGTILYLNSKSSGGFDDGAANGNCSYIQPSRITNGMRSYFQKEKWRAMVKFDELFYKAANHSLDLTIERLGRDEFNRNLERFRHVLKIAEERCIPLEVFPCTSDGKQNPKKDCLWKDSGCGSSCLDQVAEELQLW